MEDKIRKIIEGWFIFENALFEISLTHTIRENPHMLCAMRCGGGVIEYNPEILSTFKDEQIESLLKSECVRILLKHPYERQPVGCGPIAKCVASNIIIGDNYKLPGLKSVHSKDLDFPPDKSYEWYAHHMPPEAGKYVGAGTGIKCDSKDDQLAIATDLTSIWSENSFLSVQIDLVIEKISSSKSWGSIPGDLAQIIVANTAPKLDYRKMLAGFRASVISTKRKLTRMRPNRRTGFDNMGSMYQLRTRLLVAIDDSASITNKNLEVFFSVVNQTFKYGIETLDVVTFDTEIHDVMRFDCAQTQVKITGRGGTCFQPVINYAHENGYDGLLILTDGEANVPQMPDNPRFKIAWVFVNENQYKHYAGRFASLGRTLYIE